MMKLPSRSTCLIGNMHLAALHALASAHDGKLSKAALLHSIETQVPLDAWALETYDSKTRWKSIFGFASVGVVKVGYVSKARGQWQISEAGRSILATSPEPIEFVEHIRQKYLKWKQQQLTNEAAPGPLDVSELDDEPLEAPSDRMGRILKAAHEALAAELIEQIKQCDAVFFEHLVVKLLLRMGYGGSREEAGRAVGQSGDGGIDGIINEDRLGLDAIYIQAKRWKDSVGEGPIRDFKGALDARNAHIRCIYHHQLFHPCRQGGCA